MARNQSFPSFVGNAGKALAVNAAENNVEYIAAAGTGTVQDVSIVEANGISGTIANSTTLPAITLDLGAISPDTILVGADANFTDFPNAKVVIANGNTGHTYTGILGISGEAVSDGSTTSTGVGGNALTSGAHAGRGVVGVGKVSNTADTGKAIGVFGRAIDTHAGDGNVAVWANAQNGATNYSFYGEFGEMYNKNNVGFGTVTPNTALDVQGGMTHKVTTVNAATYDLLVTDYILHVTYTGTGAVTSLTLPTAQVVAGRTIIVKDAGGLAGTNNITIDTEGAEKIDGADTLVLNANYQSVTIYSNGAHWFII